MSGRALVLALAIAALPSGASAWSAISGERPTWSGAVPYHLNSRGSDDLGGYAGTEAIVRMGMDDWSRVSCTDLTTNYQGMTAATPFRYDGTAVIGWIESSWIDDPNAIGITGPSWGGGGAIMDAQMAMNGVNFEWISGSGSGSRVNTYSIVLHEGGHYFGLGHSSDGGATMYYAYSGGIASLNADDQEGICTLYPGSGGGPTDCTTTGCPTGQDCVGGVCVDAGSGTPGELCSPCGTDADCGGGSNRCLRYPEGLRCGLACSSDGTCMGGRCEAVSDGTRQCVMRDAAGAPTCTVTDPPATGGCTSDASCAGGERCDLATGDCVPTGTTGPGALGDGCTVAGDCATGLCFGGRCSERCDWLRPTTACPAGYYCDGSATGVCGEGLCLSGIPGGGGLGASCAADTDCSSALCDGGVCAEPCVPGGPTSCPSGLTCQVGTLPGCGACRIAGALGDSCAGNDDCGTGICAVAADGSSFCTRLCDTASPCPAGFDCVEAGGGAQACEPGGGAGGLGSDCSVPADCLSTLCAVGGDGEHFCTRTCNDASPCPSGYDCTVTADGVTAVCVDRPGTRGAGDMRTLVGASTCSTVPGAVPGRGTAVLLGLLAALFAVSRKKRLR